MALREYLDIIFSPKGGMAKDIDPLSRKNGDYVHGQNIHFLSQFGGTTFSVQPTLGNVEAYTLPTVTTQNKIFRLYLDSSALNNYTWDISTPNADLIASPTSVVFLGNIAASLASTMAQFVAALNASLQTYNISTTVTGTNEGYIELEIRTVPFWNYQIANAGAEFSQILVIQESIDVSASGSLLTIGSYDLNGNSFVWSTPQTQLPSILSIQNVSASPAAPLIRVTSLNHGLQSNELVVIVGVIINPSGVHEANGQWIVNVIDANNFDLLGSVFINPALPNTGQVTINSYGVGEIGVAQKNDNNGTWTYTTLLRTAQFNFVTKHQVKTYCEQNSFFYSLYWTDNYNVPRSMYYEGAFISNGALNFINPLGQYDYGTIQSETVLIRSTSVNPLVFTGQAEQGGALYAGNHRYVIRFLTENFSPTLWSDLSNPINVYDAVTTDPANIQGGNAFVPTRKVNQFLITGIVPNLFKYIELGNIYYADGVPVGTIVKRDLLTQQTTQVIIHTGLEPTTQVLDIASLLAIQADIRTALNIDAVSNRLILSNTTTNISTDFSQWTATFQHNIKYDVITGIKSRQDSTLRYGEYQDPMNVNKKVGYMLNETYRIAGKIKTTDGAITEDFWIDDIIINDNPVNTANPFGDNRRISGLTGALSMSLTDSVGEQVAIPYIELVNINWDFLINGVPVRDLVDTLFIERVDMTADNSEVVASGIVVMGVSPHAQGFDVDANALYYEEIKRDNAAVGTTNFAHIDTKVGYQAIDPATLPQPFFYDYPFAAGLNTVGTVSQIPENPDYPSVFDPQRRYMSFYSPDMLFGSQSYVFQGGDKINVFGQPVRDVDALILLPTGTVEPNIYSRLVEWTGFTGHGLLLDGTPAFITYDVEASKDIGKATTDIVDTISNQRYMKQNSQSAVLITVGTIDWIVNSAVDNPTSPVVKTTTDVNYRASVGGGNDKGVYQAQIFRAKTNKFGNIGDSKYVPTGFFTSYSGTAMGSISVFGGDVFTQKTWFEYRIPNSATSSDQNTPSPHPVVDGSYPFSYSGFGAGFAIYSQNRNNSEMINRTDSNRSWWYPLSVMTTDSWLYTYMPQASLDVVYNTGYNLINGINSNNAFDINLKRSNIQPTRIWWSDEKPIDSLVDNYTSFLPLNFKDLQLSFGEINEHRNINSQLMTLQDGHFELQYFDSTGLLVTNAQEAVLGNAGVMVQRGTALSTYGMDTPYAAIKGKTQGGKDALAWINTAIGKVMKFDPSQGTSVISDIQFMRSFFNNNLTFAGLYNTPADGKGIHGVWDDVNSEFIWTVVAWKDGVSDWDAGNNYVIGSEVIFGTVGFNEFPQIYVSKTTNSSSQPDTNPTDWTKIEIDDSNYYNAYTIAYNEVKNKFTTFYSYMPKIYLKRGKSFLSPRPVANESVTYEHLRGDYCVWYGDGTTELAERWSISGMSINEQPNIDKSLKGMMWQTQVVPDRIDIVTKNYETFMVAADCEQRQDQWAVAVKNDSRGTGINDGDTSTIFGSYAEVGISGPPRLFQLFDNFILKVRAVSRFFNT